MSEITLQINLSPGDVSYARLTVPALVRAHRSVVKTVLAVVDCCRPQRTKIVDPQSRFPVEDFNSRRNQICSIAESLRHEGYVDDVVYLRPDDALIADLWHKYLRNVVRETHDYAGCALTGYLAGLELPNTRYVLHYDSDVLLHQAAGYDWAEAALPFLKQESSLVAATPRICPPRNEQRSPLIGAYAKSGVTRLVPTTGGWRDRWFSTRCFLMDRFRLGEFLPLMQGRLLVESLLVKYLRRGYPRSPEVMMHRRIGLRGGWRLHLASTDAWLLHPLSKPAEYLELLPRIQRAVQRGEYPAEQASNPEIDIPAWQKFVNDPLSAANSRDVPVSV